MKSARAACFAAALATIGPVTPAVGQELQVPPGQWTVDYGSIRCSLGRRLGGPNSPIVVLSSYLGRDEPELIMIAGEREPLPDLPRRLRVVLAPGNVAAEGVVTRREARTRRIYDVKIEQEGFIERFASAAHMTIESGGRRIAQLQTPGAARAVAALKACNDDLLKSWGIDMAARVNWRSPPRYRSGSITNGDYPSAAIRQNMSGLSVVRFMVLPDGRAEQCVPVHSSGHELLDLTTCAAVQKNLRFHPAINAAGEPIAATFVQTVRWLLPGD